MSKARTIPEVGAAGLAIEAFAEKQPVGAVVDYAAWDRAALLDVRKHRSVLARAFRRLQKRTGAVWKCVAKVGYKRVDDAGKLDAAQDSKERGVRQFRNSMAVLVTIEDVSAMPDRDQARYHGIGNRVLVALAVGASRSKKLDGKASDEFSGRAALKAITQAIK